MAKTKHPLAFAIIGTGMVGTAIGALLKKAGHKIASLADTSPANLTRASVFLGKIPSFQDPAQAAVKADCLLITTPDDVIGQACSYVAQRANLKRKKVFHMSGAGGLDLLEPATRVGAVVGCIHPLQSFSSIEGAIKTIPGSYFGVTAGRGSKSLATSLVHDLGGIPINVTSRQKPLYHLAACMASNYLVTLMSLVESVSRSIGFSKKDAGQAFLPLVYGSLKNIEAQGSAKALTGPIARGDAGTIQKHVLALADNLPELAPIYTQLGHATINLALKKGTLTPDQAKIISGLLKGVENERTK